ncbi:MAG: hypothetical protein ACKO6Q_03555 [Bacteroidota bacterium]
MARFFLLTILCLSLLSVTLWAQPGIKRKKLDTSIAVLKKDCTLTKLVAFKDSLEKVGPQTTDIREPKATDNTWLTLLVVGSVLLIVWAGRRAWMRRREE